VYVLPEGANGAVMFTATDSVRQASRGTEHRSYASVDFSLRPAPGNAVSLRVEHFDCWACNAGKRRVLPGKDVVGQEFVFRLAPRGQEEFALAVGSKSPTYRLTHKLLTEDVLPLLFLRVPEKPKEGGSPRRWSSSKSGLQWSFGASRVSSQQVRITELISLSGGHHKVLKSDDRTFWETRSVCYDSVSRRVRAAALKSREFFAVGSKAGIRGYRHRDLSIAEIAPGTR
jgi:hypothetical protein